MTKNKKKSISKNILSKPIPNNLNSDETDNSLETNTKIITSDMDTTMLVHETSELVNTIPNIASNHIEDNANKQIQLEILETSKPIETSEIIENSKPIDTTSTLETVVKNLVEHVLISETLEKNENIKDDMNLSEQPKITDNINDKGNNIELTEIQIKNEETDTSQKKKSSGCSRGMCLIL